MDSQQLYIILGVILIALEIFVPGFVLAPLGMGALAAAFVATFTDVLVWHLLSFLVTFGIVTTVAFRYLRTWKEKKKNHQLKEGPLGLVGQTAFVVEAPESLQKPGRVKVFSDTFELHVETAESLEQLKTLAVGTPVKIVRIIGNKVEIQWPQKGN